MTPVYVLGSPRLAFPSPSTVSVFGLSAHMDATILAVDMRPSLYDIQSFLIQSVEDYSAVHVRSRQKVGTYD